MYGVKDMYDGFEQDERNERSDLRGRNSSKVHPRPTISFPDWEKEQKKLSDAGRTSEALR